MRREIEENGVRTIEVPRTKNISIQDFPGPIRIYSGTGDQISIELRGKPQFFRRLSTEQAGGALHIRCSMLTEREHGGRFQAPPTEGELSMTITAPSLTGLELNGTLSKVDCEIPLDEVRLSRVVCTSLRFKSLRLFRQIDAPNTLGNLEIDTLSELITLRNTNCTGLQIHSARNARLLLGHCELNNVDLTGSYVEVRLKLVGSNVARINAEISENLSVSSTGQTELSIQLTKNVNSLNVKFEGSASAQLAFPSAGELFIRGVGVVNLDARGDVERELTLSATGVCNYQFAGQVSGSVMATADGNSEISLIGDIRGALIAKANNLSSISHDGRIGNAEESSLLLNGHPFTFLSTPPSTVHEERADA